MNTIGALILQKQELGLAIAKGCSADIGPKACFETCAESFVDVVNGLLNGKTPEDPKTPEVRAILTAARDAVLSAVLKAKVRADYDKSTRTLAVAGPALIVACDLLDAMLDETYPS